MSLSPEHVTVIVHLHPGHTPVTSYSIPQQFPASEGKNFEKERGRLKSEETAHDQRECREESGRDNGASVSTVRIDIKVGNSKSRLTLISERRCMK